MNIKFKKFFLEIHSLWKFIQRLFKRPTINVWTAHAYNIPNSATSVQAIRKMTGPAETKRKPKFLTLHTHYL